MHISSFGNMMSAKPYPRWGSSSGSMHERGIAYSYFLGRRVRNLQIFIIKCDASAGSWVIQEVNNVGCQIWLVQLTPAGCTLWIHLKLTLMWNENDTGKPGIKTNELVGDVKMSHCLVHLAVHKVLQYQTVSPMQVPKQLTSRLKEHCEEICETPLWHSEDEEDSFL